MNRSHVTLVACLVYRFRPMIPVGRDINVKRFLIIFALVVGLHAVAVGQDPRQPPPSPGAPKPGGRSGIDFGGKVRDELLPNPYRFNAALSVVMQAVPEVIKQQKLTLDQEKSRPHEGLFITTPYVFTRGNVVSRAELERVSQLPVAEARSWASGRYRLEIRVSPVEATTTQVLVTAVIEGLAQDTLSSKWVPCVSLGVLENDLLKALRNYIDLQ